MVDLINTLREVNIVTIEDPIEILHQDKKSIVSQREVRQDTADFTVALRAAMRQDPDVILVGEMRDVETVRAALSAAETGHLVLSTLHTIDAAETINRIIDFFPPHEQKQVRIALAQALRGIVSQRLVRLADGTGRRPAIEVMINTGRTRDAILDPEDAPPLIDLISEGDFYKMQTFDQHLFQLVRDDVITYDEALSASTSPHDLTVELRQAGLVVLRPSTRRARDHVGRGLFSCPRTRYDASACRRDETRYNVSDGTRYIANGEHHGNRVLGRRRPADHRDRGDHQPAGPARRRSRRRRRARRAGCPDRGARGRRPAAGGHACPGRRAARRATSSRWAAGTASSRSSATSAARTGPTCTSPSRARCTPRWAR